MTTAMTTAITATDPTPTSPAGTAGGAISPDSGRSPRRSASRLGAVETVSSSRCDLAVIGAGPAGAATAVRAARGGARVTVFEKASPGRDKVCGDGLTPRAVAALGELGIGLDGAHRIDGLRMIAGSTRRELLWPANNRFGAHGAVWPRRALDKHLDRRGRGGRRGDHVGHRGHALAR